MIKDTDRGYSALTKRLTSGKKPKLKVGILAADGAKPSKDNPKLSVYEIALFNEFGLGVPERSFLRGWADEKQAEVVKVLRDQLAISVKRDEPLEAALERVGLYCVGSIQQRIANKGNGSYEPNAASTIKRKGSDVPLIDTGQLRSSISHAVEP